MIIEILPRRCFEESPEAESSLHWSSPNATMRSSPGCARSANACSISSIRADVSESIIVTYFYGHGSAHPMGSGNAILRVQRAIAFPYLRHCGHVSIVRNEVAQTDELSRGQACLSLASLACKAAHPVTLARITRACRVLGGPGRGIPNEHAAGLRLGPAHPTSTENALPQMPAESKCDHDEIHAVSNP